MTNATETHRRSTPHLCPPWCINPIPHETDEEIRGQLGYFHDGEPQTLTIVDRDYSDGTEQHLIVKPSRFVGGNGRAEPALVELQDEHRTLALLAPAEARQLAGMLTAAADAIDGAGRG